MKFTALDFETANRQKTSVCAVGISVYENGREIEHLYTLVKPIPYDFDYWCTQVHGITYCHVNDAPTFGEVYSLLKPRLDGVVVCHNAPFDIGCLRALVESIGLEAPESKVLCTLRLSRKFLKLQNHKLNTVAEHFGIGDFRHHNALDDARACAQIFSRLYENHSEDILKFSSDF